MTAGQLTRFAGMFLVLAAALGGAAVQATEAGHSDAPAAVTTAGGAVLLDFDWD